VGAFGSLKRRLYAGGRPGSLMRLWNRLDAATYSLGVIVPRHTGVLSVPGRRSGTIQRLPIAIADVSGAACLVSMLGPEANWVRNVEAADGHAVIRYRRRTTPVRLTLVPVAERAPILRRYLSIAPGARPHFAVPPGAPLTEFARIAPEHPTFRIHWSPD
jgi:hypothetical protein